MHNAGGRKHEGTKVHVARGNRNQQLFVVDILLYCFFCSIERAAALCFFMHLVLFSSFAACLWRRVLEHHKISLSTATFSRVSVCVRGVHVFV